MKITTLTPEDFKHLKKEDLEVYRQFLKKDLWTCLEGKDPWGIDTAEIYGAVVINDEGIPIGLALLSLYRSLYWATLLSITIKASNCDQDVGKPLLDHLEGVLRGMHSRLFSYSYSDNDPEVIRLKEILKQSEWSAPHLLLVRCHFEGHKFNAPWFIRYVKIPLPENFEFFPWTKLKPRERELLMHKRDEGGFPISVSPFHDEKSIEPLNSLGIRYKGAVIGWMITNRLDANTISYSSFYVEPEYRETTIPLCMVAKSIYLQLHSTIENGIIEMNPTLSDPPWITFFQNRFRPSAQRVESIYDVCKDISSDAWKSTRDSDDDL